MRRMIPALAIAVLAALPVCAQNFPARGDDNTSSLGSFKIQITNQFAGMFAGCPGFNNPILTSPTMYDPGTVVGRSDALLDGSAADTGGVLVGTAGTTVSEGMLSAPAGYPCYGDGTCKSGANTREIHTEVRSLKMVNLAGGSPVVRAGLWYDNPNFTTDPPSKISPGEVESRSGPNGTPDLPGSSFFDIFVQVDIPACANFPGATVYNQVPLIVKNPSVNPLPPKVVYLHDSSTTVPILFLNANPGKWNANDILGYFVLAGHGVGYTNSQTDVNAFNTYMSQQTFQCVTTASGSATSTTTSKPGAAAATQKGAKGPTGEAVIAIGSPCGTAN
jgi:hypothetical protein